jgi:4-amino-4-deoxy-L-arabinose transferase-like glycosyltransferase
LSARRDLTPALLALWLALVLLSLFSRSYIPIDETRYVTVAWNMWLRGDYLVPFLNGEAYSHKPPLLFWLMNLGWAIFGVNDWWPRLVPSFFALGSAWLTALIARKLWPEDTQAARVAPMVLLGSALWTVFTTATMFDMMVAFFTLLGVFGIVVAWQGRAVRGWGLVALAIGGGLLAKGPTILLQILPLAVLAPWWMHGAVKPQWRLWYLGMLGAVVLGALIALAWAIPAGMRGGPVYQHAIFWGQTADRMVNSFAHRRPLWWYLPLLPVMLFPWLFWIPLWRGLLRLREHMHDSGVRLCLAWMAPVFIAFSLISGKQMHYLLPIFPVFALLVARGLSVLDAPRLKPDMLLVVLATAIAGGILLYLPHYAEHHHVAPWISDIPQWGGLGLIAAAVLLILLRRSGTAHEVWRLTLMSAWVVAMLYLAVVRQAGLAYDIRPISQQLKALQDAGVPLAHSGQYHGQYQFIGRLHAAPEIVIDGNLGPWFAQHPNGKAIVYFSTRYSLQDLHADYVQPYLGDNVAIIGHDAWPPKVAKMATQAADE